MKALHPVRNRGYKAETNQFGNITTEFYANVARETETLLNEYWQF